MLKKLSKYNFKFAFSYYKIAKSLFLDFSFFIQSDLINNYVFENSDKNIK